MVVTLPSTVVNGHSGACGAGLGPGSKEISNALAPGAKGFLLRLQLQFCCWPVVACDGKDWLEAPHPQVPGVVAVRVFDSLTVTVQRKTWPPYASCN